MISGWAGSPLILTSKSIPMARRSRAFGSPRNRVGLVAERDYTDDLRLGHVLADDADSLTTARFKALDLHVMSKPDLTPVTDADEAVEESIRRTLSRVRSRDA